MLQNCIPYLYYIQVQHWYLSAGVLTTNKQREVSLFDLI